MNSARFDVGAMVRTRGDIASAHTRLPQYLAGRRGVVVAIRGAFALADEGALGMRDARIEPVYAVRFDAGEVFAETDRHGIVADLWESYLETAP